jgi:hypothetical protein
MKHTTESLFAQFLPCHLLVVLGVLTLAMLGQPMDSQAGWLTCPPQLAGLPRTALRPTPGTSLCLSTRMHSLWHYVAHSWPQPVLRSLLLMTLWAHSGQQGPDALIGWPWLVWLWQVVRAFWPELGHTPLWRGGWWMLWQGQRLLIMGSLVVVMHHRQGLDAQELARSPAAGWLPVTLGCQVCGHDEPRVEVVRLPDGGYQAIVCGHFSLRVGGDHPFRARLLLLFLRLLDGPTPRQGSRRTRDGRTPFVRQAQIADWSPNPMSAALRTTGDVAPGPRYSARLPQSF